MRKIQTIFLLILGLIFVGEKSLAQEVEKIIIVPLQVSTLPFKFQMHPLIQQYIAYYQGRGRTTMEVGLFRSGVHERMIRRIFREEGVPEELFRINQTEKMWGISERTLWSFTPQIARKYGLRKTKYLDERLSFEKATRATAQYLKFLYHKYNKNWEIAIGAYESGEGNVDYAIKRAKAKDYWKIYQYLPRETRNFVPNLLATILIANNPKNYGFEKVQPQPPLAYELVRIPPSTSLEMIAKFSEESIEIIKRLNPELIFRVTPPEPYVVRVPLGKGNIFAQRMRKLPSK